MTLRRLLGTTILATATAVGFSAGSHAQAPLGYPVSGLYLGAGAGFSIKAKEDIKNLSSNFFPLRSGLSTPNANLNFGIGPAVDGKVGWGFGNGLRAEVEFNYLSNSVSNIHGQNFLGVGASTGATGSEKTWGPMFNVLYDFYSYHVPYVVPYIGVGIGYQRAHLSSFGATGPGTLGFVAPTLSSNDTRAAFAAQGILGAALPIPAVPGLSLTAEYHFLTLTGTRTYNAGVATTVAGRRVSTFGTMQAGHSYNNEFLFGVRYNFGVVPPAPPPAPIAAPAPAPARSYLVFFDWDKATLTDRSRQIVRDAAENSTRVQYTRIEVNGYTDTSGTPQYNKGLSLRRAQTVQAELVRDGVPDSAISIQGYGDTHLLVATGPGVREPQNRRVEIVIR